MAMERNLYPSVINNFNVYKNGSRLIGQTGEVTLPDFESKSTTINGAGILGDIDDPVLGQISSTSVEIPFRTLSDDLFSICNPLEAIDVTLRGSIQCMDVESMKDVMRGMRIVMRGKAKTFKPGKVKAGEQMDCSVTLELIYILIEVNGTKMIELDKLNGVYVVNGLDLLQEINALT